MRRINKWWQHYWLIRQFCCSKHLQFKTQNKLFILLCTALRRTNKKREKKTHSTAIIPNQTCFFSLSMLVVTLKSGSKNADPIKFAHSQIFINEAKIFGMNPYNHRFTYWGGYLFFIAYRTVVGIILLDRFLESEQIKLFLGF